MRVGRRLILLPLKLLQPVLPQKFYMSAWVAIMKGLGMNIYGNPIYVSPACWIDGTDYALVTLEDKVVISSHVSLLTHDFSLARVIDALHGEQPSELAFVRPVRVGRNSFIGRYAILMPGASIGENCIVGAGAVVRGKVPDNSIVVGNPAEIVGRTTEWGEAKIRELGLTFERKEAL